MADCQQLYELKKVGHRRRKQRWTLVGAALPRGPIGTSGCLEYRLLDMLRFDKSMDGHLVPEYGSAKDSAQFKYLYAYSPNSNVKRGSVSAVLFITGDGDTRVAPLHARKNSAALQAATTSGRPILLLYDTKSGHSGGRPLSKPD